MPIKDPAITGTESLSLSLAKGPPLSCLFSQPSSLTGGLTIKAPTITGTRHQKLSGRGVTLVSKRGSATGAGVWLASPPRD